MVAAAPSKHFAKYISVWITCVLLGNTSVSNVTTLSSLRIPKGIGHTPSSRSSSVFGLVVPTCSLLVFVPLFGYSYTTPTSWYLIAPSPASTLLPRSTPGRHPTAPPLRAVDLWSLTKNTPQLRLPFRPSLMLFSTLMGDPSVMSPPTTSPILSPSGTASSPGTPRRTGLYFHFLARADPDQLSDVNFLYQGFIHCFCSHFADVA